jgi:hypothetical protein
LVFNRDGHTSRIYFMYFYIIFVRSTFEDWRLILGSLLQPIPFPNE